MRLIDLALRFDDEEYAEALASALARNVKGLNIDVPGRDDERYDVILTDDADVSGENVILLSDIEAGSHIRKYGNVMRIAKAVLEMAGDGGRDALRTGNDTDIYMFLSPYGGSGCTSCAEVFAESLRLTKEKRTLLLSMAPLAGSTGKEDPAKDIRALLYHIADGKDMSGLLRSFLTESERGVMRFRDCSGISPLSEMTPELFETFLGTVIKSGLFDAVVIDGGSHVSKALLAGATAAKRVFVISDMRRYDGEERHEEYDRLTELLSYAGIKDAVSVMNRYEASGEGDSGHEITVEEAEEGVPLTDSKRFAGSVDRLCDRFS